MITDLVANAATYKKLSPRFVAAFGFLSDGNLASLRAGRYAITGDSVFAVISEYEPFLREKAKWEAHRRYIDVHYLIFGTERIEPTPAQQLTIAAPYDEKDDYLLLAGQGDWITLSRGKFAMFYPQDAHRTGIAAGESAATVKKVVVKIEVE